MRHGAREPFFDEREGDLKKQVNALSEQHSIRYTANVKKSAWLNATRLNL
jgi:hypothetical protein